MYQLTTDKRLVLTNELKSLLSKIQHQGNIDVTYKTDEEIYGVEEEWAYPKAEGFKLVGDCEDICLYKRRLLVEAGVPSGQLLITICLDPDQQGHCVLCVVTDKNDIILCNAHDDLTTPDEMMSEGYTFLYRQQIDHGIDQPFDKLK